MYVRDVMTADVITVGVGTSLKDVAAMLAKHRIAGMPVVGPGGTVLGVVSEGDILFKERRQVERRRAPAWLARRSASGARAKDDARTAGEAMSSPAVTIMPWRPVAAAAALMLERAVNRLPVVTNDGTLVGIVTRADLVRAFARGDVEVEREIREDVLRAPLWLRAPDEITVSVDEGVVTLGGFVDTRAEAETVATLVAEVPGVVDVESSLAWHGDNGGAAGA